MSLTGESTEPQPERSTLRKFLPLTTVGIVIAFLYAGWTLYSRHENEAQAARDAAAKQSQARKDTDDMIFQHGELTFTTFEASPGLLRRGETAELCYGVVNAKSVQLDPPVEPVKPSYRHCLEISPRKTTTYTLTATGGAGQTKTVSLTVHVK